MPRGKKTPSLLQKRVSNWNCSKYEHQNASESLRKYEIHPSIHNAYFALKCSPVASSGTATLSAEDHFPLQCVDFKARSVHPLTGCLKPQMGVTPSFPAISFSMNIEYVEVKLFKTCPEVKVI